MDEERIFGRIRSLVIEEGITDPRIALGMAGAEGEEWLLLTKAQIAMVRSQPVRLLRLVSRLVSRTQSRWFRSWAYYLASWAYNMLGDFTSGEGALLIALENGFDRTDVIHRLSFMDITREDFRSARRRLADIERPVSETRYIVAILDIFAGEIARARNTLDGLLSAKKGAYFRGGAWELMGMVARAQGRFGEAADSFIAAFDWFLERGSHYSIFPLIKYQELVATGHAEPVDPRKSKRAIMLARAGGTRERAAITQYEAAELWIRNEPRPASELFLAAGKELSADAFLDEALFAYLRASYTGYLSSSETFFKAVEYLRPRLSLYRFIEMDAFYADFVRDVLLPLARFNVPREPEIRIRMFGGFSAEGFSLSGWVSRKALALLKYLLLNHGRGLSAPYLAYLLWPRKDEKSAMVRLRQEVYYIRKHAGPLGELLVSSGGRYMIREDESLWVDACRFRALVNEAEATAARSLERYLSALELYRGPLLPEDRYDRLIEEHRNALHREFCSALDRALEILSDRHEEALALARRFHEQFPEDSRIAKAYTSLLLGFGRNAEAPSVYEEFKNRLWRAHRRKPDFRLP